MVGVVLTFEQLTIQLDKVAACRSKPEIKPKAMLHLHSKLGKLDFEIFCKACEELSMKTGFMPDLKEIYEAYYAAKKEARAVNVDWKGCKYCNDGHVYYEREKPGYPGPITYLGWCRHCNPPFNKKGMRGLYSDRKYPGITFDYYDFQFEGGGKDLTQDKAAVKTFTGTQNPEKEKQREENKAQPGYEQESMEFPF